MPRCSVVSVINVPEKDVSRVGTIRGGPALFHEPAEKAIERMHLSHRGSMSQDNKSAVYMRQIDENLRRVYQETAAEEVPDRFQKLLQRLKEQDTKE
jgi:hypothetical protein